LRSGRLHRCAFPRQVQLGAVGSALLDAEIEVARFCRLSIGALTPSVTEALSVIGRGCQFFELTQTHDLKGIAAKRLADPYALRVRWLKIKNPDYTQQEGRSELFNGLRSPPVALASDQRRTQKHA